MAGIFESAKFTETYSQLRLESVCNTPSVIEDMLERRTGIRLFKLFRFLEIVGQQINKSTTRIFWEFAVQTIRGT
jgi:hypothetical protein